LCKLHGKLLVLDSDELKRQTLSAIRHLAVHNPGATVSALVGNNDAPFDDAVVRRVT
jgi:hypothetical protein